jgi:hypothetical protein
MNLKYEIGSVTSLNECNFRVVIRDAAKTKVTQG